MQYQSPAAERLLGYAAKDTLGTNGFDFVFPDDRPHLLTTFAELLQNQECTRTARVRVRHRDGSWHELDVIATNLIHNATVSGIVISGRDVTELAAAEKMQKEVAVATSTQHTTLQRRLVRQQQWVSDISHELKNPLAAIRARLEIATLHAERTDWRALISEALDEIAFVQRLIDKVHELATLDERGGQAYIGSLGNVDFCALLVAEVERVADPRLLTGIVTTAWVYGNPDHFRRIIRNLLDNALRYARDTVRLSLTTIQNQVVLTVEDDGPGIPPDARERIFQRFSQVERDQDLTRHNPGLGLAIVRHLVEQYRGDVSVCDSPLGGAKFVVTLPTHS